MRTFFVILAIGVMLFGIYGCEDEQAQREEFVVSEEAARDVERDIERSVDRELERAEEEIRRARERIESELEEAELSDEEVERLKKDVEESVSRGLARVGKALEDIGARIQEDSDVEVVDFREFREIFPSELMGMERIDWSGANKSALGMRFSKLEAEYEGRNMGMEIAILDLGTMKGLAAMGFAFIDKNIDEEDRDGFKRTREFEEWPGLESVEYQDDRTEMQGVLIVKERIVIAVNAEGSRLEKDFLEDLFDELDIRSLERAIR
jgi:hypothetical protein